MKEDGNGKNRYMEFDLIWKRLNGVSTPEEETMLDQWLREDARHRAFFDKAEKYSRYEAAFPTGIDVEAALLKVKRQRGSGRRIRKVGKYVVPLAAAMVAALIISAFIFLSPFGSTSREEAVVSLPPDSSHSIVPGRNRATLTIDDGERYELSEEEAVSLEVEGVRITGKGNEIAYADGNNGEPEELKYNTLSVPLGGEFFVILSDGSKVWLNSGTELRYPVKFGDGERLVELQGEAFFAVAPDATKPFKVQSGGQVVEALGTEFNVTAYADESAVLTTLVEGKVKVAVSGKPDSFQLLLPGSQSRFLPGSRKIRQYAVDIDEFVSWKEGWFVFRNTSLEDMMKRLSRWYDFDVTFVNERAKNLRFTGDIRRYENPDRLLSVIEKTNEVKIMIDKRMVTID